MRVAPIAIAIACATLLAAVAAPAAAKDGDPAAAAAEVLEQSGVEGGLVVHLGCGDGAFTAALRDAGPFIVQGLTRDADRLGEVRAALRARGLYGPVTVALLEDDARLPYTDNLVSLLVVEEPGDTPAGEMRRVLAPGGVACIRTPDGAWRKLEKPRPDDMDVWTHYLHDPGNNAVAHDALVGPPRHMQWIGAPEWTRYHHSLNSISSVVTDHGRLAYIVDQAPAANMNLPGKWEIAARDAFSGVLLWRKPMASWAWHRIGFRRGPAQLPRLLVADGERLYAPLGLSAPVSEIDAASGKTLRVFEETDNAEEIIVCEGTLLTVAGAPVAEQAVNDEAFADRYGFPSRKSVVAVNLEKGEEAWSFEVGGDLKPETLAASDGRVFFQVGERVRCLSLETGEPLWLFTQSEEDKPRKKLRFGTNVLVVSDGVVLCRLEDRLQALSAETGEAIWHVKGGLGFHAPMDVFVIGQRVYTGIHPSDSVAPPPVNDFNKAFDLHTGEVVATNSVAVDLQTAGHHHRCYREKATDRYIIMGKRGVEMMDLQGDDHSRSNWVRGTCQYGILPANGLIYAPAHACGCYMESKLRGFWALAPERPSVPAAAVADDARLRKGPAWGKVKDGEPGEGDWPTMRANGLRNGVTETQTPTDLEIAWRSPIGGRLTQPVIAEGALVLASIDENTVYALDETTGEERWSYTAGGRIDSAPAIHKGTVIFGSADGRVYCLRLRDGREVWRFLAAPGVMNAVSFDQVESLWPVHGSVLLMGDTVYCSAGRSTWIDGGITLYALDAETGAILHRTVYESTSPEIGSAKEQDVKGDFDERVAQNLTDRKTYLEPDRSDSFSMAGGSVSDVLVTDGYDVFLHHSRFSPELEQRDELARHLFSTSSLLDDAENHRSHWVLGTGDFSKVPIAYSWIVNKRDPKRRLPTNIAVPTAVMLTFDDQAVWSVRRIGGAMGKYALVCEDNKPFSPDEKPLPDFREMNEENWEYPLWEKELDVRTKALIKAGPNLILAVTSSDTPPEDPFAAYEGRLGGAVQVRSAEDGSLAGEFELESPAVWDGMAAANGRLFVSCEDGAVLCLGAAEPGDVEQARAKDADASPAI